MTHSMTEAGRSDKQRASDFALASVLSSYPDEAFEEVLADVKDGLATHPGARGVVEFLDGSHKLDDLRSTYVDLFDRGGDRASLYETEYGRMAGMGKGNDLADIAGFYQAFGLTVDAENVHEVVDHVSAELEFYAMLLLKQAYLDEHGDSDGSAIVEDARKKFLSDHLGRFVSAIARRESVKNNAVYGAVFEWASGIVTEECSRLGVTPPPLDFFSDEEAKGEMKCGSVHLPIVQ